MFPDACVFASFVVCLAESLAHLMWLYAQIRKTVSDHTDGSHQAPSTEHLKSHLLSLLLMLFAQQTHFAEVLKVYHLMRQRNEWELVERYALCHLRALCAIEVFHLSNRTDRIAP